MEELTKRQEDILKVLKKFMAKHGYPPTVREIGSMLNLSSPATTHFHLNKLEEKGYIRKNEAKNRALELLVPNEYLEKEAQINRIEIKTTDSFADYVTFDVNKCLMTGELDYLAKVEILLQNKYGNKVSIYRAEPYFLEIMPMNIDKAYSLRKHSERTLCC